MQIRIYRLVLVHLAFVGMTIGCQKRSDDSRLILAIYEIEYESLELAVQLIIWDDGEAVQRRARGELWRTTVASEGLAALRKAIEDSGLIDLEYGFFDQNPQKLIVLEFGGEAGRTRRVGSDSLEYMEKVLESGLALDPSSLRALIQGWRIIEVAQRSLAFADGKRVEYEFARDGIYLDLNGGL